MNNNLTLALFDLDQTLIKDDSDYLWGEFLCNQQLVDVKEYQQKNNTFFEAYKRGEMSVDGYLKFCLGALKDFRYDQLLAIRDQFIDQYIKPITSITMQRQINWHKKLNHRVIIITSTHDFITTPISKLFGVDHLISTKAEIIDDQFTGEYIKPPCFQRNKIILFEAYLQENQIIVDETYGYSDSINDLPMLQYVDFPTAVNPDNKLRKIAKTQDWKIIDWA